VAVLKLRQEEALPALKVRVRRFCLERLAPYKVPTRILVSSEPLHTTRFKRSRRAPGVRTAGAA
jgi:hypothetical protein